jgi:signal transduction histidine kinase
VPSSSRPPTRRRVAPSPAPNGPGEDARSLAVFLQRTLEAERASLARELHDELGAILTAAQLDVAWMTGQPACREPAIAQRLAALQAVLAQGSALKRRIVEDLSPGVLTHLGLIAALEHLLATHRPRFAGQWVVSIDATVALTGEPALALYRIAQESLTNIQRYARAQTIRVALGRTRGGRIALHIEDDGCGFEPGAVGASHFGLAGMRERMRAVGGEFEVVSAAGAGTAVLASMPAPRRTDAARRIGRPSVTVRSDSRAPELRA